EEPERGLCPGRDVVEEVEDSVVGVGVRLFVADVEEEGVAVDELEAEPWREIVEDEAGCRLHQEGGLLLAQLVLLGDRNLPREVVLVGDRLRVRVQTGGEARGPVKLEILRLGPHARERKGEGEGNRRRVDAHRSGLIGGWQAPSMAQGVPKKLLRRESEPTTPGHDPARYADLYRVARQLRDRGLRTIGLAPVDDRVATATTAIDLAIALADA